MVVSVRLRLKALLGVVVLGSIANWALLLCAPPVFADVLAILDRFLECGLDVVDRLGDARWFKRGDFAVFAFPFAAEPQREVFGMIAEYAFVLVDCILEHSDADFGRVHEEDFYVYVCCCVSNADDVLVVHFFSSSSISWMMTVIAVMIAAPLRS